MDFASVTDLLGELQNRFEVVVIDLPPISAGSLGVQVAGLCSSVVLVVRAGSTPLRQVQKAAASLERPPAVMLNRIESSMPSWLDRIAGPTQ
jgi:Mrp family chromosome partitioning ATPase